MEESNAPIRVVVEISRSILVAIAREQVADAFKGDLKGWSNGPGYNAVMEAVNRAVVEVVKAEDFRPDVRAAMEKIRTAIADHETRAGLKREIRAAIREMQEDGELAAAESTKKRSRP